jgi:hypothetical protein
MHKVRGNYSSCTCRSSESLFSNSGCAQEKGKTGQNRRKLSLAQKAHFWVWPPPLKANVLFWRFFFNLTRFWTKLRVLLPCFPEFTDYSIKHPENRCPYVLISLQVIRKDSTDTLWGFQKVDSLEREPMDRFSKRLSLYVKTSNSQNENRIEYLKGSHWKSENHPALVVTYMKLSDMTLEKEIEIFTIGQAEKTCRGTLIKQSSPTTN